MKNKLYILQFMEEKSIYAKEIKSKESLLYIMTVYNFNYSLLLIIYS